MLREFAFVLCSIAAGAGFGITHDLIDVRISPDFYQLLKGSPPALPPEVWAVYIGSTRGAIMGALLGVALLFAGDCGRLPRAAIRKLYGVTWLPLLFAVIGSFAGGSICWFAGDSIAALLTRYENTAVAALSDASRLNVAVVAAMHQGAYCGGVLGILIAAHRVIRFRREDSEAANCVADV